MIDKHFRGFEEAGYNWYVARGRTRPDEPLYAIQLVRADDRSVSRTDDPDFITEDENLHACIIRAQAFIKDQAT